MADHIKNNSNWYYALAVGLLFFTATKLYCDHVRELRADILECIRVQKTPQECREALK